VQAALKALGLTMWGVIAFGLLVLFGVVGYEAAIKYRAFGINAPTPSPINQPDSLPMSTQSAADKIPPPVAAATHLDASQTRLRDAATQHRYQTAVEVGRQIYDDGQATPDDLATLSLAYFALNDCPNALTWANRNRAAAALAGMGADPSLERIRSRCEPHPHHLTMDPNHLERATRLLNALRVRAENERRHLPQLEAEAQQSKLGDLQIQLGELYFGFGDYAEAIAAIQRGLEKGQVTQLADAYVYLGRSQVAQGNIAAARGAFAKLKTVPNISPRVLRLWELYADTLE
jgi:tetratricopeptide (TPR) repeat protein